MSVLQGAYRVLVTGAAGGSQGATGRLLTHLLLERGVKVRAFVRSSDDRAASLQAAGAEVQCLKRSRQLEYRSNRERFHVSWLQIS